MKDRIVEYPNRYQLSLVDGTTDTYDLTAVTGTVVEAGDNINKANMLDDNTCTALDIPTSSVPNDAFFILSIGNNRALVEVTVYKTGTTTPIANVMVNGIKTSAGGEVFTDTNGVALGYTTTATTSIGVSSEYVDLTVSSTSFSTPLSKKTSITIYATRKVNTGFLETLLTSAGYYRFTDKVLVDVHVSGGGYNGNSGFYDSDIGANYGGSGGMGGLQNYSINLAPNPKTRYQAIVGASNGGVTSFLGVTSAGGLSGGAGGNGGRNANPVQQATAGNPCTVQKYGSAGVVAGGGGAGGICQGQDLKGGGSPYGGAGTNGAGGAGTGYGGGGAGGASFYTTPYAGGAGYQGAIWFRWRYNA